MCAMMWGEKSLILALPSVLFNYERGMSYGGAPSFGTSSLSLSLSPLGLSMSNFKKSFVFSHCNNYPWSLHTFQTLKGI